MVFIGKVNRRQERLPGLSSKLILKQEKKDLPRVKKISIEVEEG